MPTNLEPIPETSVPRYIRQQAFSLQMSVDDLHGAPPMSLSSLIDAVSSFVLRGTTGRHGTTHGHKHMQEVALLALSLAGHRSHEQRKLCSDTDMYKFVVTVGFFHDYADHKYPDTAGRIKQMLGFLVRYLKFSLSDARWIIDIISLVSYTAENKARLKCPSEVGAGETVRQQHVDAVGVVGGEVLGWVSDADKITAIGKDGWLRAIEYICDEAEAKGIELTSEEIELDLQQHAREKLLRLLPDGFIRTGPGRKTAKQKHDELELLLKTKNAVHDYYVVRVARIAMVHKWTTEKGANKENEPLAL